MTACRHSSVTGAAVGLPATVHPANTDVAATTAAMYLIRSELMVHSRFGVAPSKRKGLRGDCRTHV